MAGERMAGDRSRIDVIALPHVSPDGAHVQSLQDALSRSISWHAYLVNFKFAHVPKKSALQEKELKERSTAHVSLSGGVPALSMNAPVRDATGKGRGRKRGRQEGGSPPAAVTRANEELNEGGTAGSALLAEYAARPEDTNRISQMGLRFGYVPARAARVQRLHALLLDHRRLAERDAEQDAAMVQEEESNGGGEGGGGGSGGESGRGEGGGGEGGGGECGGGDAPIWLTLSTAVDEMRLSDYLLLCGLGALPPDPDELLELMRREGAQRVASDDVASGDALATAAAAGAAVVAGESSSHGAVRMCDLREEPRDFFFRAGPQASKAAARLAQLLLLLEELSLIRRDLDAPASPFNAPTRFEVCKYATHTSWYCDTSSATATASALAPASASTAHAPVSTTAHAPVSTTAAAAASATISAPPTEMFAMQDSTQRDAYWHSLRSFCAGHLPFRGSARGQPGHRRSKARHGIKDAASHAMHSEGQPMTDGRAERQQRGPKAELPAHYTPRAQSVIRQLKEAQWSCVRPLTFGQKEALIEAMPAELPTKTSELTALADRLEVHPDQLMAYMHTARALAKREQSGGTAPGGGRGGSRTGGASGGSSSGARKGRRPKPAAAVLAGEVGRVSGEGGGGGEEDEGTEQPTVVQMQLGPRGKRKRPRVEVEAGGGDEGVLVVAEAETDEGGLESGGEGSEEGGVRLSKQWLEEEREAMALEWGRQVTSLYYSSYHVPCLGPNGGVAGGLGAGLGPGLSAGLYAGFQRVELSAADGRDAMIERALRGLAEHIDWPRVGVAGGGRGSYTCMRMITAAALGRGPAEQAAQRRRRLAIALARSFADGLERSTPPPPPLVGSVGECVMHMLALLGVDSSNGRIDPSMHPTPSNRQPVRTAREAALGTRLLALMSVPDDEYCESIGSKVLRPFTKPETNAALSAFTTSAWIVKRKKLKGTTWVTSRRYNLSHRYLRQHSLPYPAPVVTEAEAVVAAVCAGGEGAGGEGSGAGSTGGGARSTGGGARSTGGGASVTGHASPAGKRLSLPAPLGPGGVVQALEMMMRGEISISVELEEEGAAEAEEDEAAAQAVAVEAVEAQAQKGGEESSRSRRGVQGRGTGRDGGRGGPSSGRRASVRMHLLHAMLDARGGGATLEALGADAQKSFDALLPKMRLHCAKLQPAATTKTAPPSPISAAATGAATIMGPTAEGAVRGDVTTNMAADVVAGVTNGARAVVRQFGSVEEVARSDERMLGIVRGLATLGAQKPRRQQHEEEGGDGVVMDEEGMLVDDEDGGLEGGAQTYGSAGHGRLDGQGAGGRVHGQLDGEGLASTHVHLDATQAAAALSTVAAVHGQHARSLYAAIEAAGTDGTPLLQLLRGPFVDKSGPAEPQPPAVGEVAAEVAAVGVTNEVRRAEAVLLIMQALRRASLALAVCVGDERRYVTHTHIHAFWSATPYELCMEGEGSSKADGGSTSPRSPGGDASEMRTATGKRPKFASDRSYFIPEHGRTLDGGVDTDHYARLRAAIVAWVACNPGMGEVELCERFWGHPLCVLRGMLHALEIEGTLRRQTFTPLVASPLPPLSSSGQVGEVDSDASCCGTSVNHYFLASSAHALLSTSQKS